MQSKIGQLHEIEQLHEMIGMLAKMQDLDTLSPEERKDLLLRCRAAAVVAVTLQDVAGALICLQLAYAAADSEDDKSAIREDAEATAKWGHAQVDAMMNPGNAEMAKLFSPGEA